MVTEEELQNMSPEEIAELQKSNCIFCKIIAGEIPSNKVYEDDKILAILDINPAKKGHVVVLPKEHYPILPLVPPDTFKHMFVSIKKILKGLKKVTLSDSATIFIANGAVAGQQSPHFMFHIIPREKGDSLNFKMPSKAEFLDEQKTIESSLKNNLTIMMQNHLKREGVGSSNSGQSISAEEKKEKITQILEANPEVRELLSKDVEGFKSLISQNEELKNLFLGVDLEALSKTLEKITEVDSKEEKKPEVFLGKDPLNQRDKVFEYFEKKPKAKELLMDDLEKFKELLSGREDVQEIFKEVNLDKLSEKLIQSRKLKGENDD